MALTTRKPTGMAGWPNLLVEGKEGSGKTYASLSLSADPRIGAAFIVEVGERRADEYAALGEFDIVDHDGSLPGVVYAIQDVLDVPPKDGRPNLLVIDSATALWDLCKNEAERIAKHSKSAQRRLAEDPDAEIEVGHQAWNKATDRWWWSWLNQLRSWPGVALLTARADEVAKFADGKPVANQTEYRVDVQKGTPYALDGTVRMRLGKPPLVTTAKSLLFQVPTSGLELPAENPLAFCVFHMYGAGETVELDEKAAKRALLHAAKALGHDEDAAKDAAQEAWRTTAGTRSKFTAAAMSALYDALELPAKEAS